MLLAWDVAAELAGEQVQIGIPHRLHEVMLVAIVILVLVGTVALGGEKRVGVVAERLDHLAAAIDRIDQQLTLVQSEVDALVRRGHIDPLSVNDPHTGLGSRTQEYLQAVVDLEARRKDYPDC